MQMACTKLLGCFLPIPILVPAALCIKEGLIAKGMVGRPIDSNQIAESSIGVPVLVLRMVI